MIDWIWERIERIVSWRTFLTLLLFFLVFNALFYLYSAHYPRSSFDGTTCGVNPSDIADILVSFERADQLDRYLAQEWQLDLAFPAVYGLLFAVAVVGLRPRGWRLLVLLPLLAALFDYCENFTFITIVLCWRKTHTLSPGLAMIGSAASHLKWSLILPSFLAPVVALIRRYV